MKGQKMKYLKAACVMVGLGVVFAIGCDLNDLEKMIPDYLKDPKNINILSETAGKCLKGNPDRYAVGLMYVYKKQHSAAPDGGSPEYAVVKVATSKGGQANQIQAVVECGGTISSVTCDPTKGPKDDPCENLRIFDQRVVSEVKK